MGKLIDKSEEDTSDIFITKEYKKRKDGGFEIIFHCDTDALVSKSEAYNLLMAARAYTDNVDTKANISIWISIGAAVISVAACIVAIVI